MPYLTCNMAAVATNFFLEEWRDAEFENGSIPKAKRIQKVLDRRIAKYGLCPTITEKGLWFC